MKRALAVCVAVGLLASTASAGDFDRSGAYLGVGGTGAVHLVGDTFDVPGAPATELSASGGANLRVGYRALPWFAIEAQYEWIDGFDASTIVLGNFANLSSHSITADFKFLLPIGRFQPYLLLGPGASFYRIRPTNDLFSTLAAIQVFPLKVVGPSFGPQLTVSESSQWAFAGRVGLGVDAYVTRNLVLDLEVSGVLTAHHFEQSAGLRDLSALHYLSTQLGIQYRF